MKRRGLLILGLLLLASLPLTLAKSENTPLGSFGGIDYDPIFIQKVGQFLTVSTGNFTWKFAELAMGYNLIEIDGSVMIQDERWFLEYEQGQNWKPRGIPVNVSYTRHSPHSITVTREYDDYLGCLWNVSYAFFSDERPKITITASGAPSDEYRLRWEASGINKTYAIDEYQNHSVRFHNDNDLGITFNYEDVYQQFGAITEIVIGHQTGNHDLSLIFYLGSHIGSFNLDPSFGYAVGGATQSNVLNGDIKGSVYTAPADGTLTHMGCQVATYTGGFGQLLIYNNDTGALLDYTGLIVIPDFDGAGWVEQAVTLGGSITSGTDYLLLYTSNNTSSMTLRTAYDGAEVFYKNTTETFLSPPNPIEIVLDTDNWKACIYANYSAGNSYSREVSTDLTWTSLHMREWNLTRAFSLPLYTSWTVGRTWTLTRVMTQTLQLTVNAFRQLTSGGVNYIRQLTQALVFTVEAYRDTTPTFQRIITQAYSFGFNVYRSYTPYAGWLWLNVLVENILGSPIPSSVVSLWNASSGLLLATETTNATGYIPGQNMTIGDFTIQVLSSAYESHMEKFTINANTLKTIVLTLTEDVMSFPLEFVAFMFAAFGTMYYGWNQRDEENALIGYSLSFLFWLATIGQWVFDTSTNDNLIIWWVFLAPLILCALKIVEASLASLERTEKNIGKY